MQKKEGGIVPSEWKKHYFCGPKWGGKDRVRWGEGIWEKFIERMKKDVANTQGFFWGSQAMRPGQTKKKEII